MNKQDLLKNLEETLKAEQESQKVEIEKMTSEITNTLRNSLQVQLQDVRKDTMTYMLTRTFWTSVLIVLSVIILFGVLGVMIYGKKLSSDIVKLRETKQSLEETKQSLEEFVSYTAIRGIKIQLGEKGEIYLIGEKNKTEIYESTSGNNIMKVVD